MDLVLWVFVSCLLRANYILVPTYSRHDGDDDGDDNDDDGDDEQGGGDGDGECSPTLCQGCQ